ncbi:MAG: hypothetical protein HUU10_09210 [Bacteroidetes bacterium]|nr:hypothetical protein [Bacteroidota bacterium]
MLGLLLVPGLIAASVPDSLRTASMSTIPSVRQEAVFQNQASDSSRFYFPFRDLTCLQALVRPGYHFSGYGPSVKSSFFTDGLLPGDQGLVLNGFDLRDPVTGWLHPSALFISAIDGLQWGPSAFSTAAASWELSQSITQPDVPLSKVFFHQGYDRLSVFQGQFTARVTGPTTIQAGFGRTIFDGPFKSDIGFNPVLPGSSDQYQYLFQIRHQLTEGSTLRAWFNGSKIRNGNYGGVDDSLVATGQSSAYNPIDAVLVSPDKYSRTTTTLMGADWTHRDTLAGQVFSFFGRLAYQRHGYKSRGPADEYNDQTHWTGWDVELTRFRTGLEALPGGFPVQIWTGVETTSRPGSTFIPAFSSMTRFPGGLSAHTPSGLFRFSAGVTTGDLKDAADWRTFWASARMSVLNHTLSLNVSDSREPLPILDQVLLTGFADGKAIKSIRMMSASWASGNETGEYSVSVSYLQRNSPGPEWTTGRVQPDSIVYYFSSQSKARYLAGGARFLQRFGWFETDGDAAFHSDHRLPAWQTRLGAAVNLLLFRDHLYLKAGLEGYLRPESSRLYPDTRFNQIFFTGGNTPAHKQVNVFLRGKVNDILFWWQWENVTNEPGYLYDGFPIPVSVFSLGLTWWLWN